MRDQKNYSSRVIGCALVALVGGFGAVVPSAWAQPINEDLEMYPDDGVGGDRFGQSIDKDGDLAAFGAPGDDDKGSEAGSAYLFDLTLDAPHGAVRRKFLASDGAANDWFGYSIALDNGLLCVGAPGDEDHGTFGGSAYLFNASTGAQDQKLLAFDGGLYHQFGRSVAVDGGVVAVGAPGGNGNNLGSGCVYLFFANTGAQYAKLVASDGQSNDGFGISVAISNGIVAVGAFRHDNVIMNDAGAVYLFDATTGQQLRKILANDAITDDEFGASVSMSHGVLAVGAIGNDDFGSRSGAAYLFDPFTGAQIAKLLPGDGGLQQEFGTAVAISDGLVCVGAIKDDDNGAQSGSAYLFNAAGAQLKKLLPGDGMGSDWFGGSMAVDGEIVIVGAFPHNSQGSFSGAVYSFYVNCPADINGDGFLDNGDINAFIALFIAGSPLADFNGDSFLDNGDISAFIAAFLVGC